MPSLIKRSPNKTATTATDSVVKKSSANVERIAIFSVLIVALRKRSLVVKILLLYCLLIPKNFNVSIPRKESIKWFDST